VLSVGNPLPAPVGVMREDVGPLEALCLNTDFSNFLLLPLQPRHNNVLSFLSNVVLLAAAASHDGPVGSPPKQIHASNRAVAAHDGQYSR